MDNVSKKSGRCYIVYICQRTVVHGTARQHFITSFEPSCLFSSFSLILSNRVRSNDKSNCKIRYQKKCNFLSLQLSKKKNNSVTSKVTKKVTCNCNFITNNELLPFCRKIVIDVNQKCVVYFKIRKRKTNST